MKGLRIISGNLIIVALLVLGTSRILDWYNPFMDFGGHTFFMTYVLAGAAAAFLFSSLRLYLEARKETAEKLRHSRKEHHRYDGNKPAVESD